MASLRSRGEIILATASSGIAVTLLLGGRTAHSRFKIPIDIQSNSVYGIQKQKYIANLIRVVAAIIWDEAPMTNKNFLEALDRSLQDICSNIAPFGGKVWIMGGDFRQVLPVVRKEFAEFLIRIGYGVEPTKPDDMVRLPLHIAIPWEGEHSIQFPEEEHNLLSFDEVEGDNHNLYQQEFLNSIAQAKLEHSEIFQLCKELRRKNVETCFDIKITDFEDKWNTWKDEQSISSIGKLDNKLYLPFPQYGKDGYVYVDEEWSKDESKVREMRVIETLKELYESSMKKNKMLQIKIKSEALWGKLNSVSASFD
ncbi:uncharacterized protein LOC127131498 [Lathyrus oleraceus]|uniref:uncharacterized protein LOC127131498 n=1 Tax=Pisum sativum TaxID=3888 RepID=UPI0021CE6CEC|nr:uncharacterized protein LOC127131498 [Pisum sativum]